MADPANPTGDELDLKPNGTIRIGLAGKFVTLRVPKFGEFRKLKELWAGVAVEEKRITDEANAVKVEDRSPTWRVDWEMALAPHFAGWALEAVRLLATSEVDWTIDDLPAWMTSAAFGTGLFGHWTTVPLAASNQHR